MHQARDQASGPENVISERSSEPNVSSLSAFQSVLEMGYPSHVVQQAFDFLKNTKGQGKIKKLLVIFSLLKFLFEVKHNPPKPDFYFQSA